MGRSKVISRFVEGILVGLGIGLILIAGTMYLLIAGGTAELKAHENDTATEWVIVQKYSNTTVTETATVPSYQQMHSYRALADNLMAMFQFLVFLGAVFVLSGVLSSFPLRKKTPAPSKD